VKINADTDNKRRQDVREDSDETHSIIPAQPGWYVAVYAPRDNQGDECLVLDHIVAWDVERIQEGDATYRRADPITLDCTMEYDINVWAIKTPDGKFVQPTRMTYDTEGEAITALRNEWLSRQDRTAA
jgi:hypothetical protein